MKILRKLNSNLFSNGLSSFSKKISCSFSSSSDKIVFLEIDNESGLAKLLLNRPPVNSIIPEFFSGIAEAVEDAEKNKCRGIILTSNFERNFCAGLDLKSLQSPSENYLRTLWTAAQECFFKLYGTSIPTSAAINGSCPAGGCFISTCVEYRVMVDGFRIGLNESKLGISVPKMLVGLMSQLMSFHETEKSLMNGKLLTTVEALKLGLIDEIAVDKIDAIKKCEKYLQNFQNMNLEPRGITKRHLREDFMNSIHKIKEQEINCFVRSIMNEKTQKTIEIYLQSLKNKK